MKKYFLRVNKVEEFDISVMAESAEEAESIGYRYSEGEFIDGCAFEEALKEDTEVTILREE